MLEAFYRPGLTSVKAGPNGNTLTSCIWSIKITENEDIAVFDRKPGEPAHAPIRAMLMAIWKNLDDVPVFPGLASVAAQSAAATSILWPFLPMNT